MPVRQLVLDDVPGNLSDSELLARIRNPSGTVEETVTLRKEALHRGLVAKIEANLDPADRERLSLAYAAVAESRHAVHKWEGQPQSRSLTEKGRAHAAEMLKSARSEHAVAERNLAEFQKELGLWRIPPPQI